jgi:hypothetical protein
MQRKIPVTTGDQKPPELVWTLWKVEYNTGNDF